jgi:hypothetical protein
MVQVSSVYCVVCVGGCRRQSICETGEEKENVDMKRRKGGGGGEEETGKLFYEEGKKLSFGLGEIPNIPTCFTAHAHLPIDLCTSISHTLLASPCSL